MDVVRMRRAVRDYSEEPLDRGTVESLIDDATQAPSARNLQPWSFWAVAGREQVDALAGQASEWLKNESALHGIYAPMAKLLLNPRFSIFYHAPALVLVTANSQTAQSAQDCCLAAELLMLAARNRGLGSCWIGLSRPWFDSAKTKALLGIPEDHSVIAPVILGHAKGWPISQGRNQAKVHWWPNTRQA